MTAFISCLAFLLALTILVTIHEFGHFWVARKMGVKVLSFSFGFGYRLWHRFDKEGTEYAIRIIPLGGYIKMLDENEAPVSHNQLSKAFNQKPLWKRTLIVIAGPAANFLLAILLFWGLYIKGIPGVAPIISTVEPGSIAASAGLKVDDEIKSIDGKAVKTLEGVFMAFLGHVGENAPVEVTIKRPLAHTASTAKENIVVTLPRLQSETAEKQSTDIFSNLGLKFAEAAIPAVVGEVLPNTAASKAGIQTGDKIIQINKTKIRNWQDAVHFVRAHPDKRVQFRIERNGEVIDLPVVLSGLTIRDQKRIGQVGIGVQAHALPSEYSRVESYGPVSALVKSIQKVGSLSGLTLKMLWNMAFGKTDWGHLSGPVSIAKGAGSSAKLGIFSYMHFLALISISLGVLNLLPIPFLDGGHLFYYAIEAVRGRPLSERSQQIAASIGLTILLSLMAVAFYNDFVSLLGST